MFGCMIMNGALLLLVRSLSMALLAIMGGPWIWAYIGSDMGLYFLYKMLRQDAWHWAPLEGVASVIESIVLRVVVKVLVDFTGVLQLRAPGEMGGVAFVLNMVRQRESSSACKTRNTPSLTFDTRRSWRLLPHSLLPTSTTRVSTTPRTPS